MNTASSPTRPRRPPGAVFFLLTNLFYLAIVYSLSLHLFPVGKDFAAFTAPGVGWPQRVFDGVSGTFGDWLLPYHLLNLALLYACMVCVFFLTRLVLQGPWWLGSFTSVLLMANPLKSAGVLHVSASLTLLPALCALAALLFYALSAAGKGRLWLALAVASYALSSADWRTLSGLAIVIVLYELIIVAKEEGRARRLAPFVFLWVVLIVVRGVPFSLGEFDAISWLTPLYLIFYPIGLLPDTVHFIYAHPLLWLLEAAVALGVLGFICWKWRPRGLLFALAGAIAFRGFSVGVCGSDLVHMSDGGAMIVPIALMSIGLAGICQRMMQHPKWVRPVVMLTTLLCVVFFVLQIREVLAWRHAGQQALSFQARTRLASEQWPGEQLLAAPVFGYHRTAPMDLWAAVSRDTPFSRAYAVERGLQIHYALPADLSVQLERATPAEQVYLVTGAPLAQVLPESELRRAEVTEVEGGYRIVVRSAAGAFPSRVIPYRNGRAYE